MDPVATLLRPPRGVTLDPMRMPHHVAIIMDGNRRWARSRRLPAIEGHRRGIVALREVTRAASDWGIPMLTVYGFSTENWKRDSTEISLLLDLCVYFAQNELDELHRNNVRVQIIGRYEQLPSASRDALDRLVAKTTANSGLVLNLAVNYSARSELRDAVARMMADVQSGTLAPDAIEEDTIASYLTTAGMPDPDLLIRPGGESRLSNFLLYQVAYAELVLRETFWPDFSRDHFAEAIAEFQLRQRRFGGA
ncbi:isoprenyl transferase [Vulcanimicrobium alpinum]|uniref:Isoprenyl transferase n=1 Tax=Vulcanimicrobium alpinum TaxID=3016050 RepID=A0AAN1XVQ6_UNVUL|nr:isoprenyl transferase [Vulcanimicrobium alpinum]BDE06274.1 isoprenyl transferase [Vulcanimicrobium alpinum]